MKHWQLFIVMILPTIVRLPAPLGTVFSMIATIFSALWLFSVNYFGQKKIVEFGLIPMNFQRFKIHFVSIGVFIFLANLIPTDISTQHGGLISIITPIFYFPTLLLFIYIVYSFAYVLVFTGIMLAKLDERKEMNLMGSLEHILLLLVLFVWIWLLQPRLNKMFQ